MTHDIQQPSPLDAPPTPGQRRARRWSPPPPRTHLPVSRAQSVRPRTNAIQQVEPTDRVAHTDRASDMLVDPQRPGRRTKPVARIANHTVPPIRSSLPPRRTTSDVALSAEAAPPTLAHRKPKRQSFHIALSLLASAVVGTMLGYAYATYMGPVL